MSVTFFGHTSIEENADLDALWAAVAGATCGADGSPLITRYLAYPFDDGVAILPIGTIRPLQLKNPYRVLGWMIRALDGSGAPMAVAADFSVTILKWDDSTVDPIGVGTAPELAAQTKNLAYPTDWETILGDADDTIIVRLDAYVGAATGLLFTLIVQDRVLP